MDKKYIAKYIGLKVKKARKAKNYSQEQLAEMCNVTTKYISAIECGRSSGSVPLLINICIVLKIPINFIIDSELVPISENNNLALMDLKYLASYSELKEDNKEFINSTIEHLKKIQKNR